MFKVKDRQNSCVEPFEFLPAKSGEVYALGEALTYTNEVTKCAATAKPTHICMGPGDGNVVPVMPVLATTRFEEAYGRDSGDTGDYGGKRDSDHDKRRFHSDGRGRGGGRVLRLF